MELDQDLMCSIKCVPKFIGVLLYLVSTRIFGTTKRISQYRFFTIY